MEDFNTALSSLQKSKRDCSFNCRIKSYPDGSVEVCCASHQIFRETGWESRRPAPRPATRAQQLAYMQITADPERQSDILTPEEDRLLSGSNPEDALDRAKRRARSCVRDIALSNDWAWFVTLTLDGSKIDRYDMTAITRKLNQWLDNRVRRDGLAYVLVPERHKDGAVHFHGFFNGALKAVDSGTVSVPGQKRPRRPRSAAERTAWLAEGGHAVYNLPQWTLGFTTAIGLYGDRRAATSYVCKYVTKAQEKVGGRWYYSGGALRKPEVTLANANLDDIAADGDARTFTVPQMPGVSFVTLTYQDPWRVNQPPEKILE